MRVVIVGMALALASASPALAGGKGGGPSHSDLHFTKQFDQATPKTSSSPKLYRSTTTGKHISKGKLTIN